MSTIHASCVVLGDIGILIRGASGAGKSALAHMLIMRHGAKLVADDRAALEFRGDALYVRPPETLAGLLEVRGLGIVRMGYVQEAKVGLVMDLLPEAEIPRMPGAADLQTSLEGVTLPRALASSPDRGLDVLLTIIGQSGSALSPENVLASVRFDGKTKRP